MFIRKILVPLSGQYAPDDPESLDIPALRTAFAVGRRHDAHVEVLCVTHGQTQPEEPWVAWLPGAGAREIIKLMEAAGEARRHRAKAAYERVLAELDPPPVGRAAPGPGFSTTFFEHVGDIRETVGAHGRLADLIVIASARARWEMPFRPILEASLRQTASPVLVSPPTPSPSFATRIAVAWNDSVESARAVAAALSLLKAAENVVVVSCRENEDDLPAPERLLEFLAWHGIEAEAVVLAKPPRQAAGAIVGAALDTECDLLLLGAYIHTRAHTLLFGSVTEDVLSDPRLPSLLVP